ncbi:glutamyl aminopeptidase [Musca vetustissima]|uniref:glutamyl aminopeptidase n=1 Tax=Musca vetustissima TaxID=27455 RepID=UPI002AB63A07|nr:glutamyl aminopeptidase [Musca vetustissima]
MFNGEAAFAGNLNNVEAEFKFEPKNVPEQLQDETTKIDYRLPTAIKPTFYDLYLHPDIKTGTFTGQEVITLSVIEDTQKIVLHSHNLKITSVYTQSGSVKVASHEFDTVREFLIVHMEDVLAAGSSMRLGIIFEGEMLGKIVGLYSSSYLTPSNVKRTIATSQFEPTYARQAFPCFDEPNMKAKFSITLVTPTGDNYHALSNMNIESTTFLDENTEVLFATSVEMSTYLAVFIISDFVSTTRTVTPAIGEKFDVRVFATQHQLSKAEYAADTAAAVIDFFINYYKVEYPLPKLDMAAIPDFSSNAMENWGLVTYREAALLYDRSMSSTWNKQRVAAVIAHELAHMWFGYLVTLNWWNDMWLNEGFARFMEYKASNAINPSWGLTDQFLLHALHGVMKFDSTPASHPIIQTVETPDQINEIFDTISYEKGASVIRMLEDIVGSEKFEQAVTNYLTKYKYKNAVTDDFLTEVANVNPGFDVKAMMRTWTEQMGLPVIKVKRTSLTTFEITQQRFFSNVEDYNGNYNDSEFNYKWTIPLTYFYDSDKTVRRTWLDYDKSSVSVSVPMGTKWLKFNNHQVGYYRVNYEYDMWEEIISTLVATPEKFDIADRAHLLNDVFALADASQISYEVALDMTKYLEKESDFVPWYVAATKLQALQGNLMQTDIYVDYLMYARSLINKVYKEVTWNVDEDNHLKNRLRVSVITAACSLGLPDCLEEASTRFTAFLANPTNKPEPDLREAIYYYGMQRLGKQKQWEQLWDIFVAEKDSSEKLKLMYGLAAIREPWILKRFIDLAWNEDYVRSQDYFTCIQNIAANPVGEPIVWEYVRENWPTMVKRFGLNDRYFGRMIPTITERFTSETKYEEMVEFFNKYPEAGAGTNSRKQALETVKYNINWLKNNLKDVENWLNN